MHPVNEMSYLHEQHGREHWLITGGSLQISAFRKKKRENKKSIPGEEETLILGKTRKLHDLALFLIPLQVFVETKDVRTIHKYTFMRI